MPDLICTARRVGDLESRTEEYEVSYEVEGSNHPARRGLHVKYQAARAYEINAALDAASEMAREAIAEADASLKGPTDGALAQFSWRAIQSAKYQGGAPETSRLEL